MSIGIKVLARITFYIIIAVALAGEYLASVFGLPDFLSRALVYYVAYVGLFLLVVDLVVSGGKQIEIHRYSILPILFLFYVVFTAFINADVQSMEFQFRRYFAGFVSFWLLARYGEEKDIDLFCNGLFALMIPHVILCLQQVAYLNDQDNVGGIFGTTYGKSNTLCHAYLLIVALLALVRYSKHKMTMAVLIAIISMCVLCAAAAEIKVFFLEIAIMAIGCAIFSKRHLSYIAVLSFIAVAIVIGAILVIQYNPYFATFFTVEGVKRYVDSGYAGTVDAVTRTNGYAFITSKLFNYSIWKVIFGFGFSGREAALVREYNVEFFSYSIMYYYGGIVGTILYYGSFFYVSFLSYQRKNGRFFYTIFLLGAVIFSSFYNQELIAPWTAVLFFSVLAFGVIKD